MITGGGSGGPGTDALTDLPEARVFGGGPRLSVNAGAGGLLPLTGTQVPSWGGHEYDAQRVGKKDRALLSFFPGTFPPSLCPFEKPRRRASALLVNMTRICVV